MKTVNHPVVLIHPSKNPQNPDTLEACKISNQHPYVINHLGNIKACVGMLVCKLKSVASCVKIR